MVLGFWPDDFIRAKLVKILHLANFDVLNFRLIIRKFLPIVLFRIRTRRNSVA